MDSAKLKQLREETGLSFNAIKKALDDSGDDVDKAFELLRSQGALIAGKKSSRQVKAGVVDSYIHSNKRLGCLMELLCETDFVARNEEFRALAHELAMHIAAMKPADNEELLSQPYVKDPSKTVRDLVNQSIAKLGENIQIGKFEVFEV